jgi:hypothetical protein
MIHLNWETVLQSVIAGAIVSWPVFAAGLMLQHRRARTDLRKVTRAQTTDLQARLDEQTRQITGQPAGTQPEGNPPMTDSNTPVPPATGPVTPPVTPPAAPAAPAKHEGGLLNKVVTDVGKVLEAVEAFAADHGLDAALAAELKQFLARVL